MRPELTKEAATVEEAVDAALEELGVQADAASYEVLEDPSRGLFGGSKPAKVRVWLKESFVAELSAAAEDDEDDEDDVGDDEESVPAGLLEPRAETPDLTEDELDQVADTAVAVIQELLVSFGIDAAIDEYEGEEGEIILDIVGGDLGLLIGRHGKTLDAVQTVVAAVTSRKLGFRYPVVVDVEGYRGRRREKLEDMARRTADRVSRQGRAIKLRPMTSYERRVIHMALREDRRVVTGSEGEEPMRAVIVAPK
jgi:spoIIIJ-associated protein